MTGLEFQDCFIDTLELIGNDAFLIDSDDAGSFANLYKFVEQYALENQLLNTSIALPLVRAMMSRVSVELPDEFKDASEYAADFRHCLSVTRMLINLNIPLSEQEADILFASALCHILPENLSYTKADNRLTNEYHLHPEIHHIVMLLFHKGELSDTEQKRYYGRIQNHRLALLIALADRGNLMGQLYGISSWNARRYIYETRNCYFPMCIYAKEHYTELLAPINVLTEKMRCLIEVAEILLSRYEARETELVQEILSLKEENAKIKGLIQKHQAEKEERQISEQE